MYIFFCVPACRVLPGSKHQRCFHDRVKSGKFGRSAKFGKPLSLYYSSIIEIKNKFTKQTVKILMRRLIRSRLILIYTVCTCVSEFTYLPLNHSRRVGVSYKRKYVHEVLVNCLFKLAEGKKMWLGELTVPP